MKRISILLILLVQLMGVQAQTLNVNIGQVTYAYPAAQAADMAFSDNGTVLTILGRDYAVSDIDDIIVDNSVVADSTVSIAYGGATARVVVAGSIANRIEAVVKGADVTVTAADDLNGEVTYALTGSSANGSMTMNGSFKSTVTLTDLTLTSTTGAPIFINNGKRIRVILNGTNTLADCANGEQKACYYCDGHTEMEGTGTLNITGNTRHGLSSDEYFEMKSGTLNILNAVNDGMHVKQYFEMKGGKITVNASGDGIDIEAKQSDKEFNGQCFIKGGNLTITTNGAATKGLKADALITISGGTTTINTTGDGYYDTLEADITSSSAVKTPGGFTMTGGTMTLTSTGKAGKGINTTDDINISNGALTVVTTGQTVVQGTLDSKAHGIKTDGNITITGGTVLVAASSFSGNSFKTDLLFKTNGGNIMGVGAKKVTPAKSSTQGSITYAAVNVTGGSTLNYNGVSFPIPAIYSNSQAQILVSSPSL